MRLQVFVDRIDRRRGCRIELDIDGDFVVRASIASRTDIKSFVLFSAKDVSDMLSTKVHTPFSRVGVFENSIVLKDFVFPCATFI